MQLRILTSFLAVAAVLSGFVGNAAAQGKGWGHATGLIDQPKKPPAFKGFDYVNPDAPKGGLVRLSATGTFDSLNIVPPKGATPNGLGLIYDTLMTDSMDEVSTEYGLLAEAVKFPPDYSSVTYRLRQEAK